MEGISDIRIVGIDEARPPKIRKEPYIDIAFRLSHQAPVEWCKDFNNMLSKHPSNANIVEKDGLFIETWVRTPDDIVPLLEHLISSVDQCTQEYITRIEASLQQSSNKNTSGDEETGEQGRLNRIIASLDFGDITEH